MGRGHAQAIDHARPDAQRARLAARDQRDGAAPQREVDLDQPLAINEALDRLAEVDERQAGGRVASSAA
jgi:hypothetical protein